ncbi:xanthine dehydrogenase family protein molybdopterin-binding subunit [Sporosarcina thermotolerans]|uniref:Xanthine dehydrogenase family protein molybdopterin-binding subunit n=1 Tax=Sporosarcina thermotolerans TaxID=633404 RepID=A0AAW9A5D0_9BACL|nr:xanthine dehydrogenase family protein molybdopterin-binding subunit [Sporosarcina thermotolerans]MDW0116060.1 xanthine dehydrogenase family protein molybdopterin-binding subunit [Sporosarcina thermotolerans]
MNKVTGTAHYTGDFTAPGMLYAKVLTSSYAHAKIESICTADAKKCSGVKAVITGQDMPFLTGSIIHDRPILANEKVRYFGEAVAIVVANSEHEAQYACQFIKVKYEPLPVVNSISEALKSTPTLVHERLMEYYQVQQVYPEAKTNIANRTKVRKGNILIGREQSEVMVEAEFSIPQSDHAAMETRAVRAEILPSGEVIIHTSSQAPFKVKQQISKYFSINENEVIVHTPLVGGGFGGKAAVQLELIAFAASKAVEGRLVKLVNSREDDMTTSPVHIGLNAKVKLGSTKEGKLMLAEIMFSFDSGAYVDEASDITKSAALDCTGPYKIDNVWCDSFCVYTNHPYVTSFRGFGHGELTFPIERTMELLAEKLQMDPIELRMKNALKPGDTTPSQTLLTQSNIGNLSKCLDRLKELISWDEGQKVHLSDRLIRTKGISCLWKTSITPTDASSGAIITFNKDGSINLSCGVVEIGQATKTVLAQILAERMKMNTSRIHVMMEVDTQVNPKHWKTVASSSINMVGNAVLKAAEDAIQQLCRIASIVLHCSPEDLDVADERVFLKSNPIQFVHVKDIANGYKYPNGHSIGGLIIGRGSYIMQHLTTINPETGEGQSGPDWTVGAQAVEVEFDTKTYMYKIIKAISVIDIGKVLNPKGARGQVTGAMSMGLSWASREAFSFNEFGILQNNQFRTYKVFRYGENPEYVVEFIESPQLNAPYGARGCGEHGLIGMPAALANSLSKAADIPLNQLPLVPEEIWKRKREGKI